VSEIVGALRIVTIDRVPSHRAVSFALLVGILASLLATSPAAAAGQATIVRRGDRTQKVIALTFDDGWSPARTLEIVQILDKYGATATFFPYANATVGAEAMWRTIAKRFPIGDHTVSHPNLTKLSAARVFAEIDGARRTIEEITGRPMVRIFRPPYMFYNQTVLEQAYKAGFKVMALWSIDTGDSLHATDEQIYSRAIKGTNGGIVLMHAGPAGTVRVLERIILNYRTRGFTFVNLPELLGVPWSPATTCPPSGAGPTVGTGAIDDANCPIGPVLASPTAAHRAVPD
jgi:peptidoglycan/xylan/chitin deacetylase (PgdA/CDA1 family)